MHKIAIFRDNLFLEYVILLLLHRNILKKWRGA
jgi:hypothetical protein